MLNTPHFLPYVRKSILESINQAACKLATYCATLETKPFECRSPLASLCFKFTIEHLQSIPSQVHLSYIKNDLEATRVE